MGGRITLQQIQKHLIVYRFHNNKTIKLCEKGGNILKIRVNGHNTYKGYTLSSPIKVADRAFSTEKKAIRFAKKIVPVECIKKEEK